MKFFQNVRPLELFTDNPTLKFTLTWLAQEDNNKKCETPPRCHLINGTSDFSAAFEKCKVYQRGVIKGLPFVLPHLFIFLLLVKVSFYSP